MTQSSTFTRSDDAFFIHSGGAIANPIATGALPTFVTVPLSFLLPPGVPCATYEQLGLDPPGEKAPAIKTDGQKKAAAKPQPHCFVTSNGWPADELVALSRALEARGWHLLSVRAANALLRRSDRRLVVLDGRLARDNHDPEWKQ